MRCVIIILLSFVVHVSTLSSQNENWIIANGVILNFENGRASVSEVDWNVTHNLDRLYTKNDEVLLGVDVGTFWANFKFRLWRLPPRTHSQNYATGLSEYIDDLLYINLSTPNNTFYANHPSFDKVSLLLVSPHREEIFTDISSDYDKIIDRHTPFTSEILLTPHPCGGSWLILHRDLTDEYVTLRLKSDYDPSENVIVSSTGIDRIEDYTQAMLKVSPDLTTIVSHRRYADASGYTELVKLNPASGQIHDPIKLSDYVSPQGRYEFSPDGQLLYSTTYHDDEHILIQYDLSEWDIDAIENSATIISTISHTGTSDLLLGEDDKIYVIDADTSLGRIEMPMLRGDECAWTPNWYTNDFVGDFRLPSDKFIKPIRDMRWAQSIDLLPTDTTACEGTYISLQIDSLALRAGVYYEDAYFNNEMTNDMDSLLLQDGTNTLGLADDLCIYMDTMSVDLRVAASPDIGGDRLICPSDELALSPRDDAQSYLWSTGATSRDITILDTGRYTLDIIDTYGCAAADTILVSLNTDCPCDIYIPTGLSPSSSRGNDRWSPSISCPITAYQVQVYDRWGALMYTSDSPSESWDGTRDGVQCISGVYTYTLIYQKALSDRIYHETGTVTLVR